MINISKLNDKYHLEDIYIKYNEWVSIDGDYLELTKEEFDNNTINHPEFDPKGVFIADIDDEIVGFIFSHVRHIEADPIYPGYISLIIVDPNKRKMGIGTSLLDACYDFLRSKGKTKVVFSYMSTLNWPWKMDGGCHNGAPGVMVNSELYLFLINHGYEVIDHQDAFIGILKDFVRSEKVTRDLEKLKKMGITIELYDSSKHYGLEEFYKDINSEPFERVIRQNLSKDVPNPFAVVVKDNKILGWTGAFYTEPSGRAHFDGIIISPSIRGLGVGRALFSYLAEYSRDHNSKFLSFFTGRTNPARYIYLYLGFHIVKSFSIMEHGL